MSKELDEFLSRRVRNPRQREFFDERADTWDDNTVHDGTKKRYIADILDIRDGMSVLDVGSGTGVMIPEYLERIGSGHVTALDYSERMLAVAESKYPASERLSYRVMDLYDLEDEGVYDRVVCYSCFPHFPDPLEAVRVLARSLREGGLFCVAHSSSKGEINCVHAESGEEICHDFMAPMELLLEMYGMCGLETVFSRDDGEYFIALGRKV